MSLRAALRAISLLIMLTSAPVGGAHPASSPGFPHTIGEMSTRQRIQQAASVPGDELWWGGFELPITDGYISAAVRYRGEIVIGGQFSRIGDVPANNIARWNGVSWEPLGDGIEMGTVNALTVHGTDLVVAGWFRLAGGNPVRSIARWDGTEWSTFGEGLHDELTNPVEVRSVISYRDTLVAAAYFYSYGEPLPARLAYWDGSAWTWFGSGDGWIQTLSVYEDRLYVGGSLIHSMGGVEVSGIAQWNGTTWSDVGGGLTLTWNDPSVFSMHVFQNRLIVGGWYEKAGDTPAQSVAAWDGANWAPLGSGLPGGVTAMTTRNDTLYAGSANSIARWNGENWDFPSTSIYGSPSNLLPDGNDLIVLGSYHATNPGSTQPAVAQMGRLSGSGTWEPLTAHNEMMRGLATHGGGGAYVWSLIPYHGSLLAAGEFQLAGSESGWTLVSRLARWDGTSWSSFPGPPEASQILWLLTHEDTLYAGGNYNIRAGDSLGVSTSRFDGTQWTPLPGPPLSTYTMGLYRGVPVEAGVPRHATTETQIRRWTGSDWEVIGRVQAKGWNGRVSSLTEHAGHLVIAGRFDSVDGVHAENVASWDGATWHPLGGGIPSPYLYSSGLSDIVSFQGDLLAAGPAVREGGSVQTSVMRWDGIEWAPFGPDAGTVYHLAELAGILFASGDLFDPLNPSRTSSVARWIGFGWQQLGSGTNLPPHTFATYENSVYMGGGFSAAGGQASYAIARWDGFHQAPPAPSLQAGRPNPFRSATSFSYFLPAEGLVRITVHDVRGREVRLLETTTRAPGNYSVTWDGRDNRGRTMPSGVYFVRASMPQGKETSRKAVLIR